MRGGLPGMKGRVLTRLVPPRKVSLPAVIEPRVFAPPRRLSPDATKNPSLWPLPPGRHTGRQKEDHHASTVDHDLAAAAG
jgi:hypothetical protein